MKESVLSMLNKCAECGKLSYNRDGFCDEHPSEDFKAKDGKAKDTETAPPAE